MSNWLSGLFGCDCKHEAEQIVAELKDIAKAIRETSSGGITPEMIETVNKIIAETKANAARLAEADKR